VRELRAVRVSDDGREILLTETAGAPVAETDPSYVLPADERLRGMLRPRPTGTTETRPESALSPREIQARLRAGESAEEVARAAGIPVARVAGYEAPIAAERVRIVDEVRRATAPGPHRVSPGRPLGAVVDDRLSDDGLDPVLALWLARRRPDGTWLVTVDLGNHHAEWSWDGAAKRVRAHDNGAQRLLSPSRSSAEALIAVAQAAGVTAEKPETREPPTPLAPARAVGESQLAAPDAVPSRLAARSGLVVLPGEGAEAPPAAATASVQTPAPSTLDDVPGGDSAPTAAATTSPTWPPSGEDVPGSAGAATSPAPSASTGDAPEAETGSQRSRPASKAGRRRSAVPAWDDIVFGTRRS
jgi:hypothetical protein